VTAASEGALSRNRERPPGFRRATLFQLVFMTYAVICSGAYGLEEMVSASGPGLSMLLLVVLPLVYAAPISLTCAELSARFPIEGGYYRWVRLAFGEFAGYASAWLVWLTMFASNAAYAVLFGNYLRYFLPDLSSGARFLIAVALVWTAVLLNYRGISLVGTASVIFTVLIFIPFAVMTVLGLLQWHFNPVAPFVHPDKPLGTALFDGLLIAMWLYGGYEKLTVNAEEVERPARSFPVALTIAVPLCALSYIVPTLAALAANGDWQDWGESHYMKAAAAIGGKALGAGMAAGGLVSNAGILTVTILGQSRLPMVLADDGLFPPLFQRVHPRFGTPVASLVLSGVVLTALCGFRFAQLAGVYSLVQSLSYLLIYAALLRLRGRPAVGRESGFRIPLGTAGLVAMALPSVFLVSLVIRQGIWPGGVFDARQALLDLAIFASGPLTYLFIRRFSSARRAVGESTQVNDRGRPLLQGPVRGVTVVVAGIAVAAGAFGALRATPRLTLSNAGLRIDHPMAVPLYALLAAAGALALFVTLPGRGRGPRGVAALAAFGFLGLAAARAVFQVEVGRERLKVQGLAGSQGVPWAEITRVDTNAVELKLESRGRPSLRLATGALSPEQRASLERAIARHVSEAQGTVAR
jgi:amino acid transporter